MSGNRDGGYGEKKFQFLKSMKEIRGRGRMYSEKWFQCLAQRVEGVVSLPLITDLGGL